MHSKRSKLVIALAGSVLVASTAFAQNAKDRADRIQTQSTGAARSANTPETSSGGARAGFDTPSKVAPPVRANIATKPSPVGLPVTSTNTQMGFKPKPPAMRTVNVPSPAQSKNPSWNPKGDPAVARGYQQHQSVYNPRVNPRRDPAVAKGYSNAMKATPNAPSYRAASAASAPARAAPAPAPRTTSTTTSSSTTSSKKP